jgi:tubulin-specific chaperone A
MNVQAMSAEQLRSLKIKTGAVKRTTKEHLYYFKERDRELAKLQKMKGDGADPYDVKQQENVLQESTVMIPESRKSLEGLLSDLKAFLKESSSNLPPDSKEMEDARKVLSEADAALAG